MLGLQTLAQVMEQRRIKIDVHPAKGTDASGFEATLTVRGRVATVENASHTKVRAVGVGADEESATKALGQRLSGTTLILPARPENIRIKMADETSD